MLSLFYEVGVVLLFLVFYVNYYLFHFRVCDDDISKQVTVGIHEGWLYSQ